MSLNPHETVSFEDITAMLDILRDELDRGGFSSQTEALRGIEVLDRSGVEVALFTVRGFPKASANIDVLKQYVESTLNNVLMHDAA